MTADIWSIEQLQNDFNNGNPFNDEDFASNELKMLIDMGFSRPDVIEANIVTGTTNNQSLLEYLLGDSDQRKTRYETKKEEVCNEMMAKRQRLDDALAPQRRELQQLLNSLAQLEQRFLSLKKESEETVRTDARIDFYVEYLRALTINDLIRKDQIEALQDYRKQNRITMNEHRNCLKKLRITSEEWSQRTKITLQSQSGAPKDRCIFPCLHCITTAESLNLKGKCPICTKKILKVEKIFL